MHSEGKKRPLVNLGDCSQMVIVIQKLVRLHGRPSSFHRHHPDDAVCCSTAESAIAAAAAAVAAVGEELQVKVIARNVTVRREIAATV